MIKQTFYNLPEEKRNRIIDAIMKEFSNSSAEKVSINRIIKAANISRGSFYQYFDDKVDLVEVLINTFVDFSLDGIYDVLDESDGDIFYVYSKLFDMITDFAKNDKQKIIMKNLFRNIKANDDLVSEYLLNRFKGFGALQKIDGRFNRSNLKYKSDEDIKNLSQIFTQVLKNAIFNVFVAEESVDEVRKNYLRKLEIIKTGALN